MALASFVSLNLLEISIDVCKLSKNFCSYLVNNTKNSIDLKERDFPHTKIF
jgi:hypothetical protein